MSKSTKKTAAPEPPVADNPAPGADPLGLIPGLNDDPNRPPADEEPTVIIPPMDDDDDGPVANETTTPPPPEPVDPEVAPGQVGTKDGRVRVMIRGEAPPPPPPEPRAGRAQKKSDIAAAYFRRLNPGQNFAALSLQDQALWYDRAVNAGGQA